MILTADKGVLLVVMNKEGRGFVEPTNIQVLSQWSHNEVQKQADNIND